MAGGPAKITADRGRTFSTLWNLWPYMWPADRPDLKLRVVIAFGALIAAKVVGMLVPYSFKWVTDALTGHGGPPAWMPLLIAGPVALVLFYNVGRFTTTGFGRSAMRCARVGLHAARQLAHRTFQHLHDLSPAST
jgi:ATP-binding cassette subfamily B protein